MEVAAVRLLGVMVAVEESEVLEADGAEEEYLSFHFH